MNPRFAPGDPVRVRDLHIDGHVRTPGYVRGRYGAIERCCGAFRNPEDLAKGRRDGALVPLYRVRFAARELWPQDERADHTVEVELYEHWLEDAP